MFTCILLSSKHWRKIHFKDLWHLKMFSARTHIKVIVQGTYLYDVSTHTVHTHERNMEKRAVNTEMKT